MYIVNNPNPFMVQSLSFMMNHAKKNGHTKMITGIETIPDNRPNRKQMHLRVVTWHRLSCCHELPSASIRGLYKHTGRAKGYTTPSAACSECACTFPAADLPGSRNACCVIWRTPPTFQVAQWNSSLGTAFPFFIPRIKNRIAITQFIRNFGKPITDFKSCS